MQEGLALSLHHQGRVGHIAPRPVVVKIDRQLIGIGAKGEFEEARRADAIFGLATLRLDDELFRIGRSVARGDCDLPARDRERLEDQARRRLVEPVTDLIVEGDILFARVDVQMIAQPVEELRAVRLRVDRLQLDPLIIFARFGAVGLGVDIDPALALPDSGQPPQRAEVGERFGIDVLGLGEDLRG